MMHANLDWVPPPDELDRAPEFAILAALRAVLPVVTYAIVSANPELAWDNPQPPDAVAKVARSLLGNVHLLRQSIDRYRSIVAIHYPPAKPPDDDDFPF